MVEIGRWGGKGVTTDGKDHIRTETWWQVEQGHRPWQDRICLCVMDDRLDTLQLLNCFHWPGSVVYSGNSNFLPLHKGYYLHLGNVILMRHGSVMGETGWREDRGWRFRERRWKTWLSMIRSGWGNLHFLFRKPQKCDKHCNFLHPFLFPWKPEIKQGVNLQVYCVTGQQHL